MANSSSIKTPLPKQQEFPKELDNNFKVKKSYSLRESANLKEIKEKKNESFRED